MHEEVSASRIYSTEQRDRVLANLHAMSRSVARLRNGTTSSVTAGNLREALRIRLSILNDNVQGFVSAADIDRRDRYANIEGLLDDVANASALLPAEQAHHLSESLRLVGNDLRTLNSGVGGKARQAAETQLERHLVGLQAELRGDDALPPSYCGSCYGASLDPAHCCNTCDDIRRAYAERRWGFPDGSTFEQCRRESRQRSSKLRRGRGATSTAPWRWRGSRAASPSRLSRAYRAPSCSGSRRSRPSR